MSSKLKAIAERFCRFREEFGQFFKTKTRNSSAVAEQYLAGLIQTPKRNMERMGEKVPHSCDQAFQHFITNSPWDEQPLMAHIAQAANSLLGGTRDSCLLIDESGIPKKGAKSVGVARQYCGRTGKIDNCQMAVFGALVKGDKSVPLDFRLYLPKEWTDDPARCEKAGIPTEAIQLKTKCELAIEIVRDAKERGVQFGWVGADSGYGKDPGFLGALFDLGLTFVADVHKSQLIYFSNPTLTEEKGMTVNEWMDCQQDVRWKEVKIR